MRNGDQQLYPCLLFLVLLFHQSRADVGTAGFYNPPYLPTACYGRDASKFPADNLFAAAGEGIWDNGAACGRIYTVRCLSAARLRNACVPGRRVQVTIVDRAATSVSRPSTSRATLVLNVNAFRMIASPAAADVNVEFLQ
ncbi:hypothetical protein ACLOJK_031933 [Asimina triloba]